MTTEAQTLDPPRTTKKSKSVFKAARSVMLYADDSRPLSASQPRGTGARSFGATVPVIARGKGAVVTDVDGNDYLDFALSGGAVILGHADERVVAAISKAASKAFGFSDPTEAQVRLAEMIVGRFASVDTVFLTRSRARAIASAIRVARAATGRKGVLVVRGSVADQVVCAADAGFALFEAKRTARSAKRGDEAHTFIAGSGDAGALERMATEHGPTLAAVVIEPYSVSTGLCEPPEGHLARLRTLCSEHGALLVFDDSVSALRVGQGGAEAATGVAPDMTCFGTEFGGGLPLAVLGGSRDILRNAARAAGLCTVGDAPSDDLAVSAGIAVLQALNEPGFYDALNEHAVRLAEGFNTACRAAGGPMDVRRVGSLVGVVPGSVAQAGTGGNDAVTPWANFVDGLLVAGIIPPSGPLAPWAVSAAHSNEDVDRAIQAFGGAAGTNRA